MIGVGFFSIKTFNAASEVCSLVSTGNIPLYISSFGFLTLNLGFHILDALMGFRSFDESFMVKVFMSQP
jgi:hypothetical protein